LQYAIACWRLQTYHPTELLILSDAGGGRASIPDDVRYLEITAGVSVGEKRNLGCEYARGEIIAHWDDDDYSAPGRLADQVQRLIGSGKPVTGYHSMRFTDGRQWWQYRGSLDYALGTSLCYRKDFWQSNQFPSVQVGEDNSFVGAARGRGDIASADSGDLMFATIHDGNTSPRQLGAGNWKKL